MFAIISIEHRFRTNIQNVFLDDGGTMNKGIGRVQRNDLHMLNYCIVTFIVLILVLSIHSFYTMANASVKNQRVKYFTSVLVMPGENLDDIAKRYMSIEYENIKEYKNEVRQMNCLDYDCNVHIGDYIIVPYYVDSEKDN